VGEPEYHFRLVFRGRLLRSFGGLGLALCASVLWLAPSASAQSGVYDQYVEQIPTANGPHHSGSGGPGATGGSGGTGSAIVLPTSLNKDGGKDAKKLREIATSPRYGAPNSTVPLPESSTRSQAALSAAVSAATDGSDSRMIGLFVALLAVTAVSLGYAATRRRNA
jgi:hypothetical protein